MPDGRILINGHPATQIDAADRGLHYGDGLFETLAVEQGRPCLWERHMQRLQNGCARLDIPVPDTSQLLQEVFNVIGPQKNAVVKILITRGSGGRGYRAPQAVRPTRIVQSFPAESRSHEHKPRPMTARICSTPLAVNPVLAGIKTLNRLEQVLARSEWENPLVEEGLMLDVDGNLIEGTMSNVFLQQGEQLLTPDLDRCGIAGVMRGLIMDIADSLGIVVYEQTIKLTQLWAADALYVTNSLMGIRPVAQVSEHNFKIDLLDPMLLDQVLEQGFQM